jgi:hypothetical protein
VIELVVLFVHLLDEVPRLVFAHLFVVETDHIVFFALLVVLAEVF